MFFPLHLTSLVDVFFLLMAFQANIGVNTGPTFSARFPPPPSFKVRKAQSSFNAPAETPIDGLSSAKEEEEQAGAASNVSSGGRRRALTVGSSSSNEGPPPMMALQEVDDEEGDGEGLEGSSSSSDLGSPRSDSNSSGGSSLNLQSSPEKVPSLSAAAGKKARRASLGGAMTWALKGGSGAPIRRSHSSPDSASSPSSSPSLSNNASSTCSGSGSSAAATSGSAAHASLQHHQQQARSLDLAALFDVFVPTSASSSPGADLLASNSSGGSGGSEAAAVDVAGLTPEERTKRLLEARGEALKQTDQKAKLMADGAQQYRDNAARLKAETKKSANNMWPF